MLQGLAFWRVLCYNHGSACPCRGAVHQSREDAVVNSLPLPDGLALDTASWEYTPHVVQHVVGQLLAIIQEQTARIQALEARMADLEGPVQQRSSNSDRPPSSDPPYEQRPTRAGPHGKPGAKPGHPGHQQALLAPTEVIEVKPAGLRLWADGLSGHQSLRHPPGDRVARDSDVRAAFCVV